MLISIIISILFYYQAPKELPVILRADLEKVYLLGDAYLIFIVPILGIIFIFLNFYLLKFITEKEKNLRLFLLSVNMIIATLIFVILLYLYFLNF